MFTEQFNQILEYADILEKVDTAGIEPTFSILPLYNVMREDEVVPGVSHDEAMKTRLPYTTTDSRFRALSDKKGDTTVNLYDQTVHGLHEQLKRRKSAPWS